MFLISHTMGPFLGNTVPLALYMVDPTPGWNIAVLALVHYCILDFPVSDEARRSLQQPGNHVGSQSELLYFPELLLQWRRAVADALVDIDHSAYCPFSTSAGEKKLQSTLLERFSGAVSQPSCCLYFYFSPPANDIPEYAMTGTWPGLYHCHPALCCNDGDLLFPDF